jgi:HK97 family phage prohead protease
MNVNSTTWLVPGQATTTGSLSIEVKAVDDSEYAHGEFVAVLSKPVTDRDNEVVAAKAFDPLPDHITIDVDHALKTSGVVGSGVPYYDDDVLMVKGRFASTPLGQELRTLVTEGHIRTMSVAFRGAKKETKDGVTTIKSAELLNAAFVPVPANPEALVVAAKAGARHSATDREHLEAMAASLAALGYVWSCPDCAKDEEPQKSVATDDDETAKLWLRGRALAMRQYVL